MVAVINVDVCPFLHRGIDAFRLCSNLWIVRRPNLEVKTKRLLYQQIKIPG